MGEHRKAVGLTVADARAASFRGPPGRFPVLNAPFTGYPKKLHRVHKDTHRPLSSMQYRKATTATKVHGSGNPLELDEVAFQVLGYSKFFCWGDIEPDSLSFEWNFGAPVDELFKLLANEQYVDALAALRQGPWNPQELAELPEDLDVWAKALSPERRELGAMSEGVLDWLGRHGRDIYYGALLKRYPELFEGECPQGSLEMGAGAICVDTGTYYDKRDAGGLVGAVPRCSARAYVRKPGLLRDRRFAPPEMFALNSRGRLRSNRLCLRSKLRPPQQPSQLERAS